MAILLALEMAILLPLHSTLKPPFCTLFSLIFTCTYLTCRIYLFLMLSSACPFSRLHPLFLSFFPISLVSLCLVTFKISIGTTTLFFLFVVFSISIDLLFMSFVNINEFPYFIYVEISSPDVAI